MKIFIDKGGIIYDSRSKYPVLSHSPSMCYTKDTDDITAIPSPECTPYKDSTLELSFDGQGFLGKDTALLAEPFLNGIKLTLETSLDSLSEVGINLPFNFMGKKNGGGWENQYLFNSPYFDRDAGIFYAYLTCPNGASLLLVGLDGLAGWKMDYSPYSFGHFFVNLKLLKSYDKAYNQPNAEGKLTFALLPVTDFSQALSTLSQICGVPFLDYDINAQNVGGRVCFSALGEIDSFVQMIDDTEKIIPFSKEYIIPCEGEIFLTPICGGKRGGAVSLYGYSDPVTLYKRSMDTVDLNIIKEKTDGNLCEHQCWASATLRYLMKFKHTLTENEVTTYENRVLSLLDIITEKDKDRAAPRITILKEPHDTFGAYNVYKSCRVQELFFGISILLDAYKYFGDEKYYEYFVGATECLVNHYQRNDGRIEVMWGDKGDDYTTVCAPMIPLLDVALFLKGKDDDLSQKYFSCADKMAEYLYKRGMSFPTEGAANDVTEAEMEDGSISCTALCLLYYAKHRQANPCYIEKAKQILDTHDSWVMKTPICQMHGSTLRWWETQWEGDGDGPALCCGHAWTIWRAEADYLYYELTGDKSHLIKAANGFGTNLSKIQKDSRSFAIYQADLITGGGFDKSRLSFSLAPRFPKTEDCGLSRYVWIRINDTFLQN
ncbi:MAG: hypothetical protein IJ309_03005 [Clostridia bacterium]|nr:hypothetical protein [Clostridia bacterium]